MIETLQRTPLYDLHVEMGGRMVEFAGWSMPVQFSGIIEEHNHTRNACSVFDVSHMGRLILTGKDCESFLNRICTRNLTDAEINRSYYSHICREDGGILDDVIVSRLEDHWGVVCNASNREKIVAWLNQHMSGTDIKLSDQTTSTAMVAVQGPRTMEIAGDLGGEEIQSLKRYHLLVREMGPLKILIYRSGYTGEDGVELVLPASLVNMFAPKLFGTKNKPHPIIKPAGLGARDTLRIEAAMPLYGHELSEDWDSLTAGQGWCVDLEKDFIGSDAMRALKEKGLPRKIVGLELEGKRIARQHYPVYSSDGVVGEITSGTLSPTLGKSIAMALISSDHAKEGTRVEVEIRRGKRINATVVKLPFYKKPANQ